jgi:hypothetical protein
MSKSFIRLCTVCGDHFDLLPFFLKHYRGLGIEKFDFIIHLSQISHKERMTDLLNSYGISPVDYLIGTWNGAKNTDAINKYKMRFPDDWFVVADCDEFQLYPYSLDRIISTLIKSGEKYLTGCLLDRVSSTGEMNAVRADISIWQQFPYTGFISFPLMRANPLKITLSKGNILLSEGQHGVLSPDSTFPLRGKVISQVHHFKWTQTVVERLKTRLASIENGDWENTYKAYGDEIKSLLRYLRKENQKFNIHEPIFLLSKSMNTYEGYSNWQVIEKIVESWSSLQSYSQISCS